jgi:uncharacterized protein YbcI
MEDVPTVQRSPDSSDGEVTYSVSAEISRRIVALYKQTMGRGPTKSHTTIKDDHVVCVLRDSLTAAERKLVGTERGPELIEAVRDTFQDEIRAEAIAIVEQLLQREVIAFLSDHDVERDIACEVFVLAPLSGPG